MGGACPGIFIRFACSLSLVANGILEGLEELCVSDIRMTLYQGFLTTTTTTTTTILSNTMGQIDVRYLPDKLKERMSGNYISQSDKPLIQPYVAGLSERNEGLFGTIYVFSRTYEIPGKSEPTVTSHVDVLNTYFPAGNPCDIVDAGIVQVVDGIVQLSGRSSTIQGQIKKSTETSYRPQIQEAIILSLQAPPTDESGHS